MSQHKSTLWMQLTQAGLVQGDMPRTTHADSPWYIKIMLGFSGWLAALCLMAFVFMGLEAFVSEPGAMLVTGLIMIAASFGLLRASRNEFVEHLALAISLAGQAWASISFFEFATRNAGTCFFLVGLLQLSLVILMPNFVHRVFSSLIATVALSYAFTSWGYPYFFPALMMFLAAWLWLNEFNYPQYLKKIHAAGYGIILALIPLKGQSFFGQEMHDWHYLHESEIWLRPWMGEALMGAVAVYVVCKLLQRHFHSLVQPTALWVMAGTLLVCAISLEAQGIIASVIILLLGFAISNRVLTGLGIAALLFYISAYYYSLDTSLLFKSFLLLAIGLVLLALHWLINRVLPRQTEADHE